MSGPGPGNTIAADASAIVTVTVSAAAVPGTQLSFTVEAYDSIDLKLTTSIEIFVSVVNPFTLVPAVLAGGPGTTVRGDVAVQRHGGFTGPVNATITGLPTGWQPRAPGSPSSGALMSVEIDVPPSAQPRPYTATITGTFAGVTNTATLTVNVNTIIAPDFTLGATPDSLAITQGRVATSAITIAANAAGLGAVALSLSGVVPPDVRPTFNPVSAGTASILTVDVGPTAPPGTYQFSLVGTAGALVKSIPFRLTVLSAPDFSLSVAPPALTLTAGSQAATLLTVTRVGAVGAVDLDSLGLPAGMTIRFASDPVTGTNTAVTVLTSSTTPAGTHVVTLRGTASGLTRTTQLTATVNAAPPPTNNFGVQLGTDSITMAPGAMATIPVRLPRTGQLIGASIKLTSNFPNGQGFAWISPNPSTDTTATLQIALTAFAPPGAYTLLAVGDVNSGSIVRADTLIVTVAPSAVPDFALIPGQFVVVLTRGAPNTTMGLTTRRTNGFAGTIAFSAPNAPPATTSVTFVPQSVGTTILGTEVTLYAAPNATPGIYAYVLRGVSGTLTRDALITVVIN